jgi:tetratricopeptide (TPR) repeat protein
MKCRCLPDQSGTTTVVDHIRLFPRHEKVRWENRVHEQILPSIRALAHAEKIQEEVVRWENVEIQHTGYQDAALRGRKLERDLRLLQMELAEQPEHPYTLFNLGSVFHELGRHQEALRYLEHSLKASKEPTSITRKVYALIAACLRDLGRHKEALQTCQRGQQVCPGDPELLFSEALLREQTGDEAGAEACWQRLVTLKPGRHFASVTTGLTTFKARHNLAMLYRRQKRLREAEVQWRLAVATAAEFIPAWRGLANVLLSQERWAEVEPVRSALAQHGATLEATVLPARVLLGQKDYDGAKAILLPLVEAHPEVVYPWEILSHVYLQEGKDLHAAERVLHKVLELDPNNPDARNNLTVLLRQSGTGPTSTVP